MILINIDIVTMVLDSIFVHNFQDQMIAGEKIFCVCADMSSYVHVDNKKKDILVLGGFPTQDVDNIMITTEAKYPNNFTELRKRFVLSLHYNGSRDFLFVNAVKMYQFKAKVSEIKPYPFCIGNISKIFTFNNMKKKKKTELKGSVKYFFVDHNAAETNNIL